MARITRTIEELDLHLKPKFDDIQSNLIDMDSYARDVNDAVNTLQGDLILTNTSVSTVSSNLIITNNTVNNLQDDVNNLPPGMPVVTVLPLSPAENFDIPTLFLDVPDVDLRGLHGWDGTEWKRIASLEDGSVTESILAANAVSETKIKVGAITETKISDDAITAPKIRAGSITTAKLAVGSFANLCENNDFELGDITSWEKGEDWTIIQDVINAYSGLWLAKRGDNVGTTYLKNAWFKCVPNQKYVAQAFIKLSLGANGGGFVRIVTKDNDGVETVVGDGNGVIGTTYSESTVSIIVPAGAIAIRVEVGATNTIGNVFVDQCVLSINSVTVIEDGSITTEKLAADSVTANKILAGTITAGKMTITSLSSITANLGSITGGSLNINNKFTVDSDGNMTVKSGTTGARVEIKSNVIKVYDASNVLRVKIGDLNA